MCLLSASYRFCAICYTTGYAIPVRAVFETGAVNDDFDASLLLDATHTDPLHQELRDPDDATSAAGMARCWPDDLVLLSGALSTPDGGAAALLVPRAHPAIVASLGAEKAAVESAGLSSGAQAVEGSVGSSTSAPSLVEGDAMIQGAASASFFTHCGTVISVSKHAPPATSMTDALRRDALRGAAVVPVPAGTLAAEDTEAAASTAATTAATQQPRAAARLANVVSQQPRFAQPGTLEFDLACEWRQLQDQEAVERSLLSTVHEERRALLLAQQRARFDDTTVALQVCHRLSTPPCRIHSF